MIYHSINQLEKQIDGSIKGKKDAIKMSIVTLLARGNLLIQDVPGVGKTTLAYALAKATDCSFQRIRFTSGLMPSNEERLACSISLRQV